MYIEDCKLKKNKKKNKKNKNKKKKKKNKYKKKTKQITPAKHPNSICKAT